MSNETYRVTSDIDGVQTSIEVEGTIEEAFSASGLSPEKLPVRGKLIVDYGWPGPEGPYPQHVEIERTA